MNYEIFGGSFPACTITLNKGEKVFTQSGAMAWADEDLTMSTNMRGGFFKSLGRALSGTSLMFVTHTSVRNNSKITFSSSFPGTLKEFNVSGGKSYIAQKQSFLVGDDGINVEATVSKKFLAGLFGGEGIVLQRISGEGSFIVEIDGSVQELDLKENEVIKVETGHVALFESTVGYDVKAVKGFSNVLFGGQGLFLTTLTGPGKVYLQTLTAHDMAQKLKPYMPSSHTSTNVNTSSNSSNSSSSSR